MAVNSRKPSANVLKCEDGTFRAYWNIDKKRYFGPKRETVAQARADYLFAKSAATLGDWLDHCRLQQIGGPGVNGWLAAKERLAMYLHYKLTQLNEGAVRRMAAYLAETQEPNVARHTWRLLALALRAASAYGVAIPVPKVRMPAKEDRSAYLDVEATRRIIAEDEYGMAAMAVLTGMRMGELRRLKWSDVNEGAGLIRVPPIKRATVAKHIPLTDEARGVLARIPRIGTHVWTGMYPDRPVSKTAAVYHWQRLKERLGLPDDLRFHDLRATYATQLVLHGVDPKTAQALLRHADVKTTLEYYVRFSDDRAQQAARQISSALAGASYA